MNCLSVERMDNLDLKLAARLELCRRDFAEFYSFVSGWVVPDHIRILSEKLQALGHDDKLIVAMPRRHGKSTSIAQLYPIWLMGRAVAAGCDEQVGIFTYGQSLSNDNSYFARQFFNTSFYRMVFPTADIVSENITNWRIKGDHRISYTASSVGGVGTGKGFNTLIVDDPHKDWAETRNRDLTSKVYDWYQSIASTGLEKGGKIVILATRWCDHDLTARALENGGYDYLFLPAVTDEQALWPQQFPMSRLMEIKKDSGNKVWQCLYMQNPIPDEGKLIKKDFIKRCDRPKSFKNTIISWDTASTISKTADYSVGIELGIDEHNNYYVLDMIRVQFEFPELIQLIKTWGRSESIYIEEKDSGIQVMQVLRREKGRRSFIGRKPKISKEARLEAISPKFEAGKVFFTDEFAELEKELLQFPDGAHDDCVDALSQGIHNFPTVEVSAVGDRTKTIQQSAYQGIFGR